MHSNGDNLCQQLYTAPTPPPSAAPVTDCEKCTGFGACDGVDDQSKIGCGSCIGSMACVNMEPGVTIGAGSCVGEGVCLEGKGELNIMCL